MPVTFTSPDTDNLEFAVSVPTPRLPVEGLNVNFEDET